MSNEASFIHAPSARLAVGGSGIRLPGRLVLAAGLVAGLGFAPLHGQSTSGSPASTDDEASVLLPEIEVQGTRVANETPVPTYAMPVSLLTFEPRVDVQARNFAESQADIAIRGGTFENTSLRVGAVSIYDPQTGHYTAELPVGTEFLTAPVVATGAAQAFGGMNASVGGVRFGLRQIDATSGTATLAAGDYDTFRMDGYQSVARTSADGVTWAADAGAGWSRSDGSIPYGDHDFWRAGARLQRHTATSQTDFLYGYQEKFFGWPDLYTPFGVDETENLQTNLFLLSHRQTFSSGYIEASAYWRQNRDDYEFNRFVPGQYNPYQHRTRVAGAAVEGEWRMGAGLLGSSDAALHWRAEGLADELQSTALVYGRFNDRSMWKLALVPELTWDDGAGSWEAQAGVTYDDSNRFDSAFSPLASLARRWHDGGLLESVSLTYSEATQVPSYTALNSSATGGLFRGNPNLGRSTSRELELAASGRSGAWSWQAAVFGRRDDNLVDWTYTTNVNARRASAVDIDTEGVELFVRHSTESLDLMLGYTLLTKVPDYGTSVVTASFYALNYPRQRLTLATIWRPVHGLEVRVDNELRHQAANALRGSDADAWLTTATVTYKPSFADGVSIFVSADNLWNDDFQEVPAVPAGRRTVIGGVTYAW